MKGLPIKSAATKLEEVQDFIRYKIKTASSDAVKEALQSVLIASNTI